MPTEEQRQSIIQDLKAHFKVAYDTELEYIIVPGLPYEATPLVPVIDEISFVLNVTAVRSWHDKKDIRIALYQFADNWYEMHPKDREWYFIMEFDFDPVDARASSVAVNVIIASLVTLFPLKKPDTSPKEGQPTLWEQPV